MLPSLAECPAIAKYPGSWHGDARSITNSRGQNGRRGKWRGCTAAGAGEVYSMVVMCAATHVRKRRREAHMTWQSGVGIVGLVAALSKEIGGTPEQAAGTTGAMSKLGGSASGLAGAASAFSKLGLSPDMVGKAVPVLTAFVSKSGGTDV